MSQIRWVLLLVLGTAFLSVAGVVGAQTTAPPSTAQSAPSSTTPVKPATRRKSSGQVQRIPMETAPATAPAGPTKTAEQQAADAKLLAQQQEQSDKAAKVTDAVVDKAQKRQDQIQSEQRVQSAPGPSQTGVVPASGPVVVPAPTNQNIQTTTSPALPPVQSVNPSQLPQPAPSSPPL